MQCCCWLDGGQALVNEHHENLRRVGPDSPAGRLLRRYWLPVGASGDVVAQRPTKQVRILGEDLVLYRDLSGALGIIQERCPHQRISLAYAKPELNGIRCYFHGWRFDHRGICIELPVPGAAGEDVNAVAYPVHELGGLAFAYLGPEPAPPLPRYDVLRAQGGSRHIGVSKVPWSWVDSLDAARADAGFLFPVLLVTGGASSAALEFHVPVDDSHTRRILYRYYPDPGDVLGSTTIFEIPWLLEDDDAMYAMERRRDEVGASSIASQLLDHVDRFMRGETVLTGDFGSRNGLFRPKLGDGRGESGLASATVPKERLLKYMPPPGRV